MKTNAQCDSHSVPETALNPNQRPRAIIAPLPQANADTPERLFNLWVALDLLRGRWHWLILGPAFGASLFFLLGTRMVKPKFTATAELLRYEALGKSDYFKTTPVSSETFVAMIRSPDLLRIVGANVVPRITPETFNKMIKVDPETDSDMVKIQLAERDPRKAVNLLNLYITNAVEFILTNEARQAAALANDYLKQEVRKMDEDISALQEQLKRTPDASHLTNRLAHVSGQVNAMSTNLAAPSQPSMVSFSRQAQRLQTAMDELNDLMLTYTDLHPKVQAKRAQVQELQRELGHISTNGHPSSATWTAVAALPGEGLNPDLDIIHIKMLALQDVKVELSRRQMEAQLYAANPPGSVKVFSPASLATVGSNHRRLKLGVVSIFGSLLGLGASIGLVLLVEFADNRLKTGDDVSRVTQLPLLATLGSLRAMKPEARMQWAFRAWTMLQGRLSPSANFGLVCGITSSAPGEGRSTWINLLAEAASMTGFRVLTIATRPSPTRVEAQENSPQDIPVNESELSDSGQQPSALTTSVLASPAQVTDQLTGPNSQPVVHIPLPGWVWNLERRKQWREALDQWRRIDNLVILVELPPACVPEAVLLGSNLPNMVWLANSGTSGATETRAQLETLRHARCNLVGAVLNRQPATPLKKLFPRWLSPLIFVAAIGLSGTAQKASGATPDPGSDEVRSTVTAESAENARTNLRFSIISPSQRAKWQQHLTLGPGDVLTFNLYGQPELARADVAIGPDGRVSYLEAQDVMASGLSIDELRTAIDQELSKYRRAPKTVITPMAFHSKKYYMLGKIATKGVYTLDRPLTILEAIARAHGLETALVDRNLVCLADLQHSFIARGGKRMALNFEALFQHGDLSQNIAIEPNDYIYIAPGDLAEVYVVGEVRLPGPVSFRPDLTIIQAIADRGGYTDRAFKARVVVVRGSLDKPLTFAVNTHAILDAKAQDFTLAANDIIYVNSRPFIKVEEAVDLAATAFVESVITSWVGVDVVKPASVQ